MELNYFHFLNMRSELECTVQALLKIPDGDIQPSFHFFQYYPCLNRSRCCLKGICTECFMQMNPPNCNRPTQCPFCKTSNYVVEYRGVKTQEEKALNKLKTYIESLPNNVGKTPILNYFHFFQTQDFQQLTHTFQGK
jgi:hypothetical protein